MRTSHLPARWLALALAAALGAAPAFAGPPEHAGGGKQERKADKQERKADKGDKADRKGDRQARRGDARAPRQGAYFDDRDRDSVRRYYASYDGGKRCPPGLAKKNNGCMPPGQAKKWHVGQPLPAGVAVYTVPQPILVTLPPPPPRHKYVRVAGDILLIAIGTSMVVDGINGLMN